MKTTAATQQTVMKQQEFEKLFSEHGKIPKDFDQYYFALTELGRETLAQALAIRQRGAERLRRPFEDFA